MIRDDIGRSGWHWVFGMTLGVGDDTCSLGMIQRGVVIVEQNPPKNFCFFFNFFLPKNHLFANIYFRD